jgi:hypothetical protein
MSILTIVGGVLCAAVGAVFLLQGLNILPGSAMTGVAFWAWAGLGLLVFGSHRCTPGCIADRPGTVRTGHDLLTLLRAKRRDASIRRGQVLAPWNHACTCRRSLPQWSSRRSISCCESWL